MRCLPIVVSCGLLALLASSVQAQGRRGRGEQEAVKNGWNYSLEDSKAKAKASGKPMMVVVRCVP